MTFDTFDTYNTDEAYKDKGTTAKGLVSAYKKDNPNGTKEDFYSKLNKTWAQDKDGHVKNAVEEAFKVDTPKEEEKVVETEKETAPKKETVDKQTEEYMNNNNAISYTQEDAENKRQSDELGKRWDARLANIDKMTQSMKNIDDHMVEQLPTFMFKRFSNGEFGDPKTSDAKLRLTHFLLNGVQSKLKNASNAAMIAAGKSPMFSDTTSDYEKYQQTNFAQGMENRWNKYKQETQSAIDLAKQGGMSEEALTDSIATISSNNRLQSAFNQMNERQKVFALQVLGEIGNKLGNMNDTQFVNTLMGMSAMGQDLDYKEAAAMLIYRTVKDPEKRNTILSSLGFDGTSLGGSDILGGFGNALTGGNKEEDNENKDVTDVGFAMNDEEFEALRKKSDDLSAKYYNGEMSKDEFVKEWDKLYNTMQKHPVYKKKNNVRLLSSKEILAANKELELKNKFGEDTKSKTYKAGKKAVDYFSDKTKLFEYFKNAESPNFIDAKEATKNKDYKMKDYQEALKQYEILKSAGATGLVGKY